MSWLRQRPSTTMSSEKFRVADSFLCFYVLAALKDRTIIKSILYVECDHSPIFLAVVGCWAASNRNFKNIYVIWIKTWIIDIAVWGVFGGTDFLLSWSLNKWYMFACIWCSHSVKTALSGMPWTKLHSNNLLKMHKHASSMWFIF